LLSLYFNKKILSTTKLSALPPKFDVERVVMLSAWTDITGDYWFCERIC